MSGGDRQLTQAPPPAAAIVCQGTHQSHCLMKSPSDAFLDGMAGQRYKVSARTAISFKVQSRRWRSSLL